MPARNQAIVIEQGAAFSKTLQMGTDRNGQACRAYLYDRFGGTLLATFSATTVAAGVTVISLTSAQTAALATPLWADADDREVSYGVWMLESDASAGTERCYQGKAILSLTVTR